MPGDGRHRRPSRLLRRARTKLAPPAFQGSLAAETPPFTIEGPTLLRYQSDGPIFVIYLQEDVVQNLPTGVSGEAVYRIANPGTDSLQISGADTWRIGGRAGRGSMDDALRARGFVERLDLDADAQHARWFADRVDGLRVVPLAHLVPARNGTAATP